MLSDILIPLRPFRAPQNLSFISRCALSGYVVVRALCVCVCVCVCVYVRERERESERERKGGNSADLSTPPGGKDDDGRWWWSSRGP